MKPYRFKKNIFNDGILNKSVDATYIIHLENNGRFNHIQEQLSEYHPTSIVYILFNKGYKDSKKKSFIINPPLDLVDSFLEIFKHAEIHNYNNILILEDDFIFSKKIKEIKHINNVNNIINKLDNNDFIYLLGCIPLLMIPYDLHNYRIFRSLGTHAVIYSKKNRIKTLKINQEQIHDWDGFNWNNNRITYYIPLCYQLYPKTENSKYWGYENQTTFNKKLGELCQYILHLFNLDKKIEPGTTIIYFIVKLLFWIIIFVIIILISKFFQHKSLFNVTKLSLK